MLSTLRNTTRPEGGFTLIELLIVLIIIGVLLAIAVPSYLGFKERAENRAAQANVRAGIPAVEAYLVDNGSYAGLSILSLQAIDNGVKLVAAVSENSDEGYCIQSNSTGAAGGMKPHRYRGGKHPVSVTDVGEIVAGTC